ncbi:MAG: hypothetical protein KDC65_05950 [Saprospiraceae bacterium]|nr:hypothetical protein [Saprospiraceae bacterium]
MKNTPLRAGGRLLAVLALLLFHGSSCKNDPKTSSGSDAALTGGTVTIRMDGAANTLNPYLPSTGYSRYVAVRIFNTLAELDPETLELKPLILKKMPVKREVKDGPHAGQLAYDFEILDEAQWDNGSPVTGHDMAFVLKIIFHPGLPTDVYRGYFEYLKGLDVDPANPKKFTAYFSQYYMLMVESMCGIPIYPAYNYDPNNDLGNIPLSDFLDPSKADEIRNNPKAQAFAKEFQEAKYVNDKNFVSGSGAYRLESTDGDQGTVLVKKEDWWGDAVVDKNPLLAAYPSKLVYKIVVDAAATENLLKTGAIDVAANMPPSKFIEMKADPSLQDKFDFLAYGAAQYTRWAMNLRNPKLADKRVRQALAHIVDYDYLIKDVMQGLAQRIVGPVNPAKSFYAKDIPLYDYNLEKAKALLAEAGWKDTDGNGIVDKVLNGKKTDLVLELIAGTKAKVHELTCLSLEENARRAGIRINVVGVDIERLRNDTGEGKFETAIYGAALDPGLVEMYQSFHSASMAPNGDNRTGFSKADSVIVAIRTTEDEATRGALYVKAQEIIHEEVPEIYLYAALQRVVVSNRFDYMLTANRPGYYEQMFKLKPKQ